MPPRFYTSPYKNALATPAKREGWWSELPVSTTAPSDSSNLIAATGDYWIAQGSTSGSLVAHSYGDTGKLGGKVDRLETGLRTVHSFQVSPFDDLLAAADDQGHINVFELPSLDSLASSPSIPAVVSISHSASKPVDTLVFHPTSSGVLLVSSAAALSIYDLAASAPTPTYDIVGSGPHWSAEWSPDGKYVSATGKDGKLRLWDVRVDSRQVVSEVVCHAGAKASRHVHLPRTNQILTTGFSRTRDREYSLFDGRMLGNPIKTQRIDSSTGVIMPLVDSDRSIVYLVGRGDMSLKWVEIGGPAIFTEGSTPFPSQISGAALVPPQQLDLMKAEINRLVVLSKDSVIPVNVNVPRRQYIDFHQDLFPETSSRQPAQSSPEWIQGKDAIVETYKPDPSAPFVSKPSKPTKTLAPSQNSTSSSSAPTPAKQQIETPPAAEDREARVAVPSKPLQTETLAESSVQSLSTLSLDTTKPQSTVTTSLTKTSGQAAESASNGTPSTPSQSNVTTSTPVISSRTAMPASNGTTTTTSERFNPGWSRNFLLGKTPLKPDYFDVHDLSVTMSADIELVKANSDFFVFPLSGPGGRLAVHPIAHKGRLPVHIPALMCGSTVVNFELDPFDNRRVFVACDDDAVRVFEVPHAGALEEDYSATARVLKDSSMSKIVVLRHHPAAKNTLLTVSDDRGAPKARIWDAETGQLVLTRDLPAGGISSAAWSLDGSKLAVSTKKKQVCILDPRSASTSKIVSCAAHESIRPAMLTWANDHYLVSTGFTRSSSRELILYRYDPEVETLEPVGRQILDVSPALLIPFVDVDTNILFAYARGERSCLAYEIHFPSTTGKASFSKLPAFDHPTLQSGFAFLPKTQNDVRQVEIVKALRLTPATVEAVSFTVPRMKTEYFQDDIFVPTRNREQPSMTAQEWLQGHNTRLELVSLQPDGMKPLSQAPAPAKTVSTRSKIKDDGLTDSQREQQYMDRLFESAQEENRKGDEDEEDDEPQIGRSRVGAPSDDEHW
ncbi:uncharacterized protein JCM15063_000767 [Sporobolomyces koalae]|uniref:uncharacterized protein n=1 Tax=Sporobolomyces koalae TaxID=500713 RepID=UPI0031715ECD